VRVHEVEGASVTLGSLGVAQPASTRSAQSTTGWTVQQARNLALDLGERFGDFPFLIRDRGSNFIRSFDAVFQATGTTILRPALQAPRMNAICERLIGTLRLRNIRILSAGWAHIGPCIAQGTLDGSLVALPGLVRLVPGRSGVGDVG
jgi:hypothetical protein